MALENETLRGQLKIGEKKDNVLKIYLSDICTLPINITGITGLSIPAGFSDDLPVGLQIVGKPFAKETPLRVVCAYEQTTEWHKQMLRL